MIRYVLAVLLAAVLLVASPIAARADDRTRGLELWSKIHQVLSHPRCANCHVGPDRVPMWSGPEYGPAPRPHGMNISAKDVDKDGANDGTHFLACTTCHMKQNSDTPHGPPGATGPDGAVAWQLPSSDRQWFGKSSAEICDQIKTRSGKPSLDKVADHIREDKLVSWGWKPGPGRDPAPYSARELADFVQEWGAAGAPCP